MSFQNEALYLHYSLLFITGKEWSSEDILKQTKKGINLMITSIASGHVTCILLIVLFLAEAPTEHAHQSSRQW